MRNYLFEREQAPGVGAGLPEASGKQLRRQKRRMVLSAMSFLVLICGLTAALVWFQQTEGSILSHLEEAGGSDGSYDGSDRYFGIDPGVREDEANVVTRIPRAPVGVDPLLEVVPHQGEVLSGAEIYPKVLPSVVGVNAFGVDVGSSGSGVVLSANGYIVTNYHVIQGMSRATVTSLDSGKTTPAKLVGYDADMDLAVLKTDREDLVPAEFGSSRDLAVGEAVYAIGNPMGYLYGTFHDGIVSYLDRSVAVSGHSMSLIQTNIALNSGNSGGALINRWGQVVGITVAKIDPPSNVTTEGLGLAIPISEAKRCVNMLLRLGEIEAPVIGITGRSWRGGDGVEIAQISPEGPAEAAGLQENDVILTAGGQPVDSIEELKDVIFALGVGAEMTCTVLRDGEELEFTLRLAPA